jgi:hypothetical protein
LDHEKLFAAMIDYNAGDAKQIQHFMKVHSFALRIGLGEAVDKETLFTLEAAAIVHDIGIKAAIKKHGSGAGPHQEREGPPIAREMLERLQYPRVVIDRVCYLVAHHHTYTDISGIDYQILIEADFLVNIFESNMSEDAVNSAYHNIFQTKTGKRICETMFRGLIEL